MADPLTIFGGVAASVQLVDIAAKLSRELYCFLRSVHSAGEDVQSQLTTIKDVQAILSLVSSYTISLQSQRSSSANSGSAQLSNCLHNLSDELRSIQKLIPTQPHTTFKVKTRWALRRKEFSTHMRNIEDRKTNLVIVLEAVSLQNHESLLRYTNDMKDNMRKLQARVDETNTATNTIRDTVSTLQSQAISTQDDHAHLLHRILHEIPRQGAQTSDDVSLQTDQIRRIENVLPVSQALQHSTDANTKLLQDLNDALPTEMSKISGRLDKLTQLASSTSPQPCVLLAQYDIAPTTENIVARIAREQTRQLMIPVLDAVYQTQQRNEILVETLKRVTDDLSMRLWGESLLETGIKEGSTNLTASTPTPNTEITVPNVDHEYISPRSITGSGLDVVNLAPVYEPQISHHTPKYLSSSWSYWSKFSWFGTIRVEVKTRKIWNRALHRWTSNVSVSVSFWPSWPLLRKRCIALLYETKPSHHGYYHIFPMIATFPIISDVAPVIRFIWRNDLHSLRYALTNGLAGPNDQDEDGWTLMHYAAGYGNLEACKLLLHMGADANRTTIHGLLPLEFLIYCCLYLFEPHQTVTLPVVDVAQTLLDASNGLEVAIAPPLFKYLSLSTLNRDLAVLKAVSALFRKDGVNLAHYLRNPWAILLAAGMDVNNSQDPYDSPIFSVLVLIYRHKDEVSRELDGIMKNLYDLLDAGADIYTIAWLPKAKETTPERFILYGTPIMTPTTSATKLEIEHLWKQGLRHAGYDPLEVYAEDERRRRDHLRNHGAASTVVEIEEGEEPESTFRMRNRRVYVDDE